MRRNTSTAILGAAALLAATTVGAQAPPLTLPRPSQNASISQTIGLTEITLSYCRPGVRGRAIWGALVPYGQVWRAGANENTTITFSSLVTIAGTKVPAGTYGLHMIPADGPWTVILSGTSTAWGSFGYEEDEDVLRFPATPEPAPNEEFMSFSFDDPGPTSVIVALRWEQLRLPFEVQVDTPAVVTAALRAQLRGLHQFFWQPWNQAANYCLQNTSDLETALEWADRSIASNENFSNLATKSRILAAMGKKQEADALLEKAMPTATEAELNQFGYQLLGTGETQRAIEIFKLNVERHPDSWNVHDSLGEAYDRAGNLARAIELYTEALAMAPDAQKPRIEAILSRLRGN